MIDTVKNKRLTDWEEAIIWFEIIWLHKLFSRKNLIVFFLRQKVGEKKPKIPTSLRRSQKAPQKQSSAGKDKQTKERNKNR